MDRKFSSSTALFNVNESSDSDSDSSQGPSSEDYKLLSVMFSVKPTQKEKIEKIKKALDQGANINVRAHLNKENTPLHIAVKKGELEVVEFLLKLGADSQIKNEQGEIPLMLALKRAATGELKATEIVTQLVTVLPEPLRPNIALFAAMLKKKSSITPEERMAAIKQALAQGADINAQDSSNQDNTVLHQAVLLEEREVVRFLLEQGADSQIKNGKGEIPLLTALKRKALGKLKEPEGVIALLANALPAALSATIALFNALLSPNRSQWERIFAIQDALAQGADINAQDSSDQSNTILHQAILQAATEVVQFLLGQGANAQIKNDKGEMPVMLALKRTATGELNTPEMVEALMGALPEPLSATIALFKALLPHGATQPGCIADLQKALIQGADIHAPDSSDQDNTVLHQATLQGKAEVVRFLLENGANPRLKNRAGQDPVTLAMKTNAAGQIENWTLFAQFVAFDDGLAKHLITELTQAFPAPLEPDTMLSIALLPSRLTQQERIAAIQNALNQGADINTQNRGDQDNTVLHQAVLLKEPEVVQFLLEQGADAQIKNMRGEMPLLSALKRRATGQQELDRIIELLANALPVPLRANNLLFAVMLPQGVTQEERITAIQNALDQGADINAQDSSDHNNTPLHQAVQRSMLEVVQFLLEQGADGNIKNQSGDSAYKIANLRYTLEMDGPEQRAADRRLCLRLMAFDDESVQIYADSINAEGITALDSDLTAQDFVNFANAFSKQGSQPNCQQALATVATYIHTKGIENYNFTPKALKTLGEAFGKYREIPACQQVMADITAQGQLQPASTSQACSLPPLVQMLPAGDNVPLGVAATISVPATTHTEQHASPCLDLTPSHP